jgi:uncharacterized membrane protein
LDLIKEATIWLAAGAEAIGAAIIGLGVIEGAVRVLLIFIARRGANEPGGDRQEAKENVRLHLGRWLAVALEFELGADILRTAVAPTWSEIGQLAAIAGVRTALNYFLQKEIDKAQARGRAKEVRG